MGFKDKVRNKQNSEHTTIEEYHKSVHEKYLASRSKIVSVATNTADIQESISTEPVAEDNSVVIDEQKSEVITVEAVSEMEQATVSASELTAAETQIKKKPHFKKKDNTNN